MKAKITLIVERDIKSIPQSCCECPFAYHCDGVIANMTKSGGYQLRVKYTRERAKDCPLQVID